MEEIFKYYDTHAHYGEFGLGCNKKYRRFYEDTNQLLENARKAGVVKIVNVAIGIDSNEGILSVLENAGEIPEIRFAFGEHPNSVGTEADCGLDAQKDALIEKFLEHEKACAVKTGLDLYKGKDNQFRQRERFLKRIQQSIKHGLPLVLHVRDAGMEAINLLKEVSDGKLYEGVVHCFTDTPDLAHAYAALGFSIGIGGKVTYPENKMVIQTVKEIPLEKIVLETDAPFISLYRKSGRGESADIPQIAKRIAELKNLELEKVANQTYQNAEKIFG